MIRSEWVIEQPIETPNSRPRKILSPKTLKQIARESRQLNGKKLNDKLAKKLINSFYFSDRALQVRFSFTID